MANGFPLLEILPESTPELQEVYRPMLEVYRGGSQESYTTFGQTPEQVGRVVIRAATEETPHFRYPTSEMIQNLVAQKYVDPSGDSMVALVGKRLSK